MVKCVFCGKETEPYLGVHLMTNLGSVDFYCSSKCRKNSLKLQRDKKKLKWTEAFRIVKQKGIDKADRLDKAEKAKAAENKA